MSKLWYAAVADETDDWGYGSYELNKAKQMAIDLEDNRAYIAVVEDYICIAEIMQDEFDNYGNKFDETTYDVCMVYRSF